MSKRHKLTNVVPFLLGFACCCLLAAGSDELSPRGAFAEKMHTDGIVSAGGAVAPIDAPGKGDCVADINEDDFVDIIDLLIVLADWGCEDDDCEADINEDGFVDIIDLLIVLADWGPCEDD